MSSAPGGSHVSVTAETAAPALWRMASAHRYFLHLRQEHRSSTLPLESLVAAGVSRMAKNRRRWTPRRPSDDPPAGGPDIGRSQRRNYFNQFATVAQAVPFAHRKMTPPDPSRHRLLGPSPSYPVQ